MLRIQVFSYIIDKIYHCFFFQLYFTRDLFDIIIFNINKYATFKKIGSDSRRS